MNRLFLYSQYTDPSENSTGFYFSRLISALGARFKDFQVIPNTPLICKSRGRGYFSKRSKKNSLLSRLFEQLSVSLGLCVRVFFRLRRGDVLLTGTNPTLLFLWLPILKKLFGFSWVLVVHDVFPDNLVPAGILNNNTFLYRVADAFFSRAYSSADRLIVIGRDMERLLMKKTHGGVCTTYIPNWACDSEVFPLSKSDALFVEDLGWGNKIVFQFFGNIGRLQAIDVILEAIALTRNNEHAFLFIGGGAMVDKVEEFIDSHPDINVAYVGNLPLDDKVRGLAACDVAIVSLEAGMSGIGVPSKSYFSMAADKPIIALMDSGSEIADVVTAHDIGWHVEANDACGLAKVFDSISDCDIRMMRGRPRRVLVSRYSERAALDSYCDCVAELLT